MISQPQPAVKQISPLAKIVFLIIFPINYVFLRYTSNGDFLNKFFFYDLPEFTTLQDSYKWIIVRSFLAKVGLLIFINVIMTVAARILSKNIAPAESPDPVFITLLNRILQNTLQQTSIFASMYVYFIFDKNIDYLKPNQLIVLGSWFLWARVVFLVSYSLGTFINITTLRALGFSINLAINCILVQLCFFPTFHLASLVFTQ